MESCTVLFLHNSPCQKYIEINIYLILKAIWILRVGHYGHVFKNIMHRKLWNLNFPWQRNAFGSTWNTPVVIADGGALSAFDSPLRWFSQ